MSSVAEESSINALTSSRNTSFSLSTRGGDDSSSSRLTAEIIAKECVRNGYYRNPICNEVLYLHHKGITEIDPDAFDRYTEAKVLWLEGNGLTSLACGEDFVQVKPPKTKKMFEEETEEEEEEEDVEKEDDGCIVAGSEGREKEDCDSHCSDDDGSKEACVGGDVQRHVDPTVALPLSSSPGGTPNHSCSGCEGTKDEQSSFTGVASAPCRIVPSTFSALPENEMIPPEKKDIFSSLYKKVRQLYLHNNVLRAMPDLSRFQRLDTVNLSNNFFPAIRCGCPQWKARMTCDPEEKKKQALFPETDKGNAAEEGNEGVTAALDKRCSEMVVVHPHEGDNPAGAVSIPPCEATDDAYVKRLPFGAVDIPSSMMRTRVVPAEEAEVERQEQLQRWTAQAEQYRQFCSHEPLEEETLSKKWNEICVAQRCPCSSLRTLNVAGNHLEFFEDLCGVLCYKNLNVLDLSQNHIKDGEMLLLILERLPRLRSLKLSGNPLVRSLRRYRKTVISRCRQLLYLDDRPVFEEERRMVNAWAVGGDEREEAERKAIKEEGEAKKKKQLDDFRRLIQKSKKQVEEREKNEVEGSGKGHPHAQYINAITTSEALNSVVEEEDEESSTSSSTSSDGDSALSHSRIVNANKECPKECVPATDPPPRLPDLGAVEKETTNRILSSPVALPMKDASLVSRESAVSAAPVNQALEDKENKSASDDDAVFIPS